MNIILEAALALFLFASSGVMLVAAWKLWKMKD